MRSVICSASRSLVWLCDRVVGSMPLPLHCLLKFAIRISVAGADNLRRRRMVRHGVMAGRAEFVGDRAAVPSIAVGRRAS